MVDSETMPSSALHPAPAGGDALERFHPLIQRWFRGRLGAPSEPQKLGWPLIMAGRDVLVAAPTGSGKTLAAFLACLDALLRDALEGRLEDETRVLYVSPLKALGNDVQRNLLQPLDELFALAESEGLAPQPIRVQVRSGDTSSSQRAAMVRRPPHILITTPESLFLYLTAARSRETLRSVETVIVDELHALARDKRGSHFALSMQRLESLTRSPPLLVGLSATQKPLQVFAAFLSGGRARGPEVVRVGHLRPWEVRVETPDDELSAVATHEMWGQIYDRIVSLAAEHRTLLVFANTRRLAERVAHDLGLRLGAEQVAAHHGSMSRESRLSAESRLKDGRLRVMVATASLELGIDIGSVDLVCQLGSPRSISALLQRIGRAGHRLGGVSRGIVFAMTRDELVEAAALVRAVRRGELDTVRPPDKPLDVLAQQIVAEAACEDCDEEALFARFRRAWPFRDLRREEFDQVVAMLSSGFALRRGHARALLHRDRVNGRIRARRGARMTALTNAGTIPDSFQYRVLAEPEERTVGSVDEDFATESMAGDVFLLGSTAWRVRRVSQGVVRVEDAKGQAPNVPFWRAEAPSRTDELSAEVSRLREEIVRTTNGDGDNDDRLADELSASLGLARGAAATLAAYVRTGASALGAVPTQQHVVAERFFDESGGMQLILHAPFGGRINRAWGLALRKRFCRIFDFELQAAATDDGILLSLGEQHSFPLEEVFEFLSPDSVEEVLTQAVLQLPLFTTRFRWVAGRALALERIKMGRRVPPHLQRARNEDLLASVFPAQVGCQDNRAAESIEVPDHPLVQEALRDCLRENMDVDGLARVLRGIKSGRIQTRAVDLPGPSPFAHQFLESQPYTFLDDAPLEERRARAVSRRRSLSPEDAAAFGALDPAAIDRVIADARPMARDPDELHDALLQLGVSREEDLPDQFLDELLRGRRACRVVVWQHDRFLVSAEQLPIALALFPDAPRLPRLTPLPGDAPLSREEAASRVVRGHLEIAGPVTARELSRRTGVGEDEVTVALHALESEGTVLRGQFRPVEDRAGLDLEWCDRRLLQRIHRLTLGRLRAEIEPLSARDFMRFLFRWHHLEPSEGFQGRGGLKRAISLLQGFEAPASAWEHALIAPRMRHYVPELLDLACWSGEVAWGRLTLRDLSENGTGPARGSGTIPLPTRRAVVPGRNARLTFALREDLEWLLQAARGAPGEAGAPGRLSTAAREVAGALDRRGASFFVDLTQATRRLPSEVEDALWELLAHGLITADAIENLRALQRPAHKRGRGTGRGGPGRWSLLRPLEPLPRDELLERLARLFLERYGIVWRDLVAREPLAPAWWELLRVYRRLEARGEIRGGRFVSGFAGEQFALADAVQAAREVRRARPTGARLLIAAVDPLNLTGIVTPGPRVPALAGNVVAYLDGVPQPGARPGPLGPERPFNREMAPGHPALEADDEVGAEPG